MKIKILLLAIIVSQSLFCQDFRFGKVSKEELKEKAHPLDSTANAAVLFKKHYTSIEYSRNEGFYLSTDVLERIKIYNAEGFDWANKKIKLYKNNNQKDKLLGLKAITYYLDENDQIEEEKLRNRGVFDKEVSEFINVTQFTMPQIQPGCVIEYKYTITSPFLGDINSYYLQSKIPVNKAQVHFESPEYLSYKFHQKGWVPFQVKTSTSSDKIVLHNAGGKSSKISYLKSIYEVDLENVPALKEEAYAGNIENYATLLKFELSFTKFPNSTIETYTTTWEDVCQNIYKSDSFGDQLKTTNYFNDDIDQVLKGSSTPYQKMLAIYEYVKQKMNWNSYLGYYTNEGVRSAYKNGAGNIGDINLMLTAMLRYAGLDANPVLISTKSNGIPIFPTRNGFNYVIAGVQMNNHTFLLDASIKIGEPNFLPPKILNWRGRMVRKDGSSAWVSLSPKTHATQNTMIMATLQPNLNIEGQSRNHYTGHYALSFRKKYKNLNSQEIRKSLEARKKGTELSHISFKNLDSLYQPVKLNYQFKSFGFAEHIGDKIYISPLMFVATETNPFKLKERTYPVDYGYPFKDRYIITFNIPEGYKIVSAPEQAFFKLNENTGSFKYITSVSENQIQISAEFSINQAFILADKYEALKKFYSMLIEKENEKIVLVKS